MMAQWGKCDFKELKNMADRLERLQEADLDKVCRKTANEIAKVLLNKVKKRTPVGVKPEGISEEIRKQYWSGYKGGSLRDAWTILPVEQHGNDYVITVINPLEYASYVEYGHRQRPGRYVPALGKRLKVSWVKGRFMLTISTQEVERLTPKLLERAVYEALKGVFDGK